MTKKSEHSEIEDLIMGSLLGDTSDENLERLDEWKQKSEKNELSYAHLKKAWDAKLEEPKYINYQALEERIIEGGYGRISKRNTFRTITIGIFKAAAVIALLMAVSFGIYEMTTVDQTALNPSPVAEVEMVTKYNPPGQKSRIILPDNSIVWLNSDSRLTYQKGFAADVRYLKLEGEAYFDVERDVNRPFIVQSGSVKTIALGTTFNIRDYEDEPSINVALLSGKVRVETVSDTEADYLLDPNQKLELSKDAKLINKVAFDQDFVSIWKDGIIHFEKDSFNYVMKTLERSYDVEIDTRGYNGRGWSYTGEFNNMSLELILKRIGYSEGFDFKINGKRIMITNKL